MKVSNFNFISVDSALSQTSENPVQNKIISAALKEATDNISFLTNRVHSAGFVSPDGYIFLQAGASDTDYYRLQLNSNGSLGLWHTSDGGTTWSGYNIDVETVVTALPLPAGISTGSIYKVKTGNTAQIIFDNIQVTDASQAGFNIGATPIITCTGALHNFANTNSWAYVAPSGDVAFVNVPAGGYWGTITAIVQ